MLIFTAYANLRHSYACGHETHLCMSFFAPLEGISNVQTQHIKVYRCGMNWFMVKLRPRQAVSVGSRCIGLKDVRQREAADVIVWVQLLDSNRKSLGKMPHCLVLIRDYQNQIMATPLLLNALRAYRSFG